MKLLIALMLLLSINSAFAEVCYGRNESCQAKRNLICGRIEKLNDSTYRVSHLRHITGCLAWGVSKYKSKNKICKNILKKYGETRKVRFLQDSDARGEMDTFLGIESTGQIDCEVRGK